MICPNKNDKVFIELSKYYNELEIYQIFIDNGYDLPSMANTIKLIEDKIKLDKSKLLSAPEETFITPNIKPGVAELFEENPEFSSQIYEALGFNINKLESFLDELGLGFLLDSTAEQYSIDKNKKHRLVKIKENTGEIDETKQVAAYDPTTNTIIFSKNASLKEIIHELIHHVLHREAVYFGDNLNLQGTRNKDQKYIDKGKIVGKELKEHLLSNVKKYFGTEISKLLDYNENSRSYFEELLTYYLTSSKFREELDSLPAEIRDKILSIINELLENHFTEEQINKVKELSNSSNIINNQITPQQKQQAQQLYSQYLDTAKPNVILPTDRIVFGHPTIGKSFLKNQGEDKFISLDDDYATEINNKVKEIADKYNVTTYQVKDGGTQKWNNEYNQMMQEIFNVAKQKAISENKTLFTSNTNLLRNNAESFDKVINLTDKEFERRIQERGAKYDVKEWKSQINEAISKLPANKIINTNKYLSDLFLGSKQDIEGFKKFTESKSFDPKEGVSELFESNPELANAVYEAVGFGNKQNTIASTIFELEPDITKEKLKTIYNNYVALMNRQREGKAISYDAFESLLKTYQVYKHKDTYIFGNYDINTATFITRINSSPSSKELLAEAIPNLVKSGLDFISFVPKDYADKLVRSGYTASVSSFNYNFKGEEMDKFAVASNPNVFKKIFNKGYKDVTSEEIENYNKSQDLKYTPVEIKEDLIKNAGRESSKIFETYLNQFGITVKNINEIKDKLEIDEIGFADLLSKIAYVKDKKDLPPIAGEFIAYMMQYNPLVKDIITELSKTDKYRNLDKSQYFKIIGELISQDLQNKIEGNYNQSLIGKIKELINKFFELFKSVPIDKINTNIGIISNNVLQQNKKLITASLYKPGAFGKPTQQVNIEDALRKDKFGASVIYKLSKQGFILTGSTALSEQGTILRPDENPLHDIDWVSPFSRKETEEKFLESYPNAIKVRDIYGDGYVTDSYLIAPEGYSISNYKVDNFNGKIIINSYDIIDSKGNVVGTYRLQKQESNKQSEEVVTGVEGKVIDFFTYENYSDRNPNKSFNYKSKEGTVIQLSNWKDIFKAKLDFARYKDIWDYNRFIPNENIQTLSQQKQQATLLYSKYLEQNPNGSVEQFESWVDEFNNLGFSNDELPFQKIGSKQGESFDKELAQKIQDKLQKLYPEIKLNITNNPVWEQGDNIFNQEEFNNQVNYRLKATEILLSDKAKQVFDKGEKNKWDLNKILTELQVPKEQKQLILDFGITDREQLALELASKYSYTVEVNTAKVSENIQSIQEVEPGLWNFREQDFYSYSEAVDAKNEYNEDRKETPTQHYSNLTVPGGTNYIENEIATPAITPSIKGHAQFATNKGIGWFRSDEQTEGGELIEYDDDKNQRTIQESRGGTATKTRRILEVQSDLFQKGRDKEKLVKDYSEKHNKVIVKKTQKEKFLFIEVFYQGDSYSRKLWNDEYSKENEDLIIKELTDRLKEEAISVNQNNFLQLLNKDNNWITFFVKSIIQDSAKQGYEKVLFPSGNTASKVEGHTTLEEFKKQKENRLKELEQLKKQGKTISNNPQVLNDFGIESETSIDIEINQLKQELKRVEIEGFGALKPIYNFYENTVTNILKKQGYNPVLITDEYGNTWNEININQARDLANVLLQKDEAGKIIGQANIKAMTVLVDAINQKQDTLPHEYAHHYIAWFRNTPIVQEAIKKWGSEEALVQSIGEQVVAQKGEAYNWWNKFVKWIMNKFNSLSKLQKEELTQILTDAFLTRQNLANIQSNKDMEISIFAVEDWTSENNECGI